jgi:hypothetical protein
VVLIYLIPKFSPFVVGQLVIDKPLRPPYNDPHTQAERQKRVAAAEKRRETAPLSSSWETPLDNPGPSEAAGLARPPLVTLPDILHQVDSLCKSSTKFPEQLVGLLSGEEYEACILALQDEEAVRLIECLDKASVVVHYPLSTEPA